eukprot:4747065-Amphidinium_carterae.1
MQERFELEQENVLRLATSAESWETPLHRTVRQTQNCTSHKQKLVDSGESSRRREHVVMLPEPQGERGTMVHALALVANFKAQETKRQKAKKSQTQGALASVQSKRLKQLLWHTPSKIINM